MKITTCTAPVNIAVIKYWGKRDESLILPINDSISVTLSSDQMHAKTTVAVSPNFDSDRIWLNGKEESVENPRLANCLREVRQRARKGNGDCKDFLEWKVHICSENNFPTAAGLASSAAGYACLVSALCQLYEVEGDISSLARQGSGSACRSVYGGFVQWEMGSAADGRDSVAKQLQSAQHWQDMRVLILVANDSQKKVPSSKGMKLSVETSELLKYRADTIVPNRVTQMQKAISDRDFQTFAELTMKDSNQFHAICLDTFPPCVYMNATSHVVADLVHQVNSISEKYLACYTFDAGPNPCLFLMKEQVPLFLALVQHFFPPAEEDGINYIRGASVETTLDQQALSNVLSNIKLPTIKGGLKYVIHTCVGAGPQVLDKGHLLDADGLPLGQ